MRRLLRWLVYLVGGLVVLLLCGMAAVYAISEYQLRRSHEMTPVSVAVPSDAASIEEGRRLARLRGCYMGCHGDLGGGILVDEPFLARLVSPNLTEAAARYSDEALARIIRFGIRPDGTSTIAMPSDMFYYLSDADLGRIIAFLRSAKPVAGDLPGTRIRTLARLGLVTGRFRPDAERVAALGDRPDTPEPGASVEYGEYLARTTCTECHGQQLEGGEDLMATPPLTIVKGYSRRDFGRLMREGVALGGRELRLMSRVARGRFSVFTDSELDALYAYLGTYTPPPAPGG